MIVHLRIIADVQAACRAEPLAPGVHIGSA
jgi:hypothetical protein